jgi:hypothetical protein
MNDASDACALVHASLFSLLRSCSGSSRTQNRTCELELSTENCRSANDISVSGGPEPTPCHGANVRHLVPAHPGSLQHDTLRQTVSPLDLHFRPCEIENLDHDFVLRSGIVGIHDADAIGNEQTALERRAASGENSQKMTGRYLDNETCPDERHSARRNRQIVSCSEVEPSCFVGGVRRKRNCGT